MKGSLTGLMQGTLLQVASSKIKTGLEIFFL